ncbi:hypothetical protein CYMTET_10123, partial [Cymbomonas tetramitiformis]
LLGSVTARRPAPCASILLGAAAEVDPALALFDAWAARRAPGGISPPKEGKGKVRVTRPARSPAKGGVAEGGDSVKRHLESVLEFSLLKQVTAVQKILNQIPGLDKFAVTLVKEHHVGLHNINSLTATEFQSLGIPLHLAKALYKRLRLQRTCEILEASGVRNGLKEFRRRKDEIAAMLSSCPGVEEHAERLVLEELMDPERLRCCSASQLQLAGIPLGAAHMLTALWTEQANQISQ